MGGYGALGQAGAPGGICPLGGSGLLDGPFGFFEGDGPRRPLIRLPRRPAASFFFAGGSLNRTEKCSKEYQADEEFYLHFGGKKCE